MDRFSTMTVFLRVVETGSFTKAADSLAMSRATVSMAVQQLEEHVGARLLHRNHPAREPHPRGRSLP